MSKHKLEVLLNGEFTTVDVFIEGQEIPLREIENNRYYKTYTEFEITDPLDISVRLKGWTGMKWKFIIKVDNNEAYTNEGVFDSKGFVTFPKENFRARFNKQQ